jgi:hypothetical protein
LPVGSVRASGVGGADQAEELERHRLKSWIEAAKKRLHYNVLAIALANKLAGSPEAFLRTGETSRRPNLPAQSRNDVTPHPSTRRGLREDEKRWRIGLPGACERQ